MVQVIWFNGVKEDINANTLQPYFLKYMFNKYLKDNEIEDRTNEYNFNKIIDDNDRYDIPVQNSLGFVKQYKQALNAVKKLDVNEEAQKYLQIKTSRKQEGLKGNLRLDGNYPSVTFDESNTPKGIAEFSGYSTSKNYPRDEEYPEDFEDDEDRPAKFSELQEQIIDGTYLMTKQQFKDAYSIKMTKAEIMKADDGDVKFNYDKEGKIKSTSSKYKITYNLKSNGEWNRSFLRKSGFMPQITESNSNIRRESTARPISKDPKLRFERDALDEKGEPTGEKEKVVMDYFSPKMTPLQRGEYLKRADQDAIRVKEAKTVILPASKTMMSKIEKMEKEAKKKAENSENSFSEARSKVIPAVKKSFDKLNILQVIGKSMLRNVMFVNDAEITVVFSSSGNKKDKSKLTLGRIDVAIEVKKEIRIKPTKGFFPRQTAESGYNVGIEESYGKDSYAPVSKARERLIKSVSVRLEDLEDILDALEDKVEGLKQNE